MPRHRFINALSRIGLWLCSLVVAVLLFSLLLSLGMGGAGAIFPIFRVTMTFALPVACLYLPVLIGFRDTEERRMPIVLLGGVLIGPVAMALWCLVLQWRGGDMHAIWHGDPLIGMGGFVAMLFALVVGSLTTLFYVFGLKARRHVWAR